MKPQGFRTGEAAILARPSLIAGGLKMSTCRIVKALELIHQAKACADKSWPDLVACLDQAEDELLRLKVELALALAR
jgi:hypothetical protein